MVLERPTVTRIPKTREFPFVVVYTDGTGAGTRLRRRTEPQPVETHTIALQYRVDDDGVVHESLVLRQVYELFKVTRKGLRADQPGAVYHYRLRKTT